MNTFTIICLIIIGLCLLITFVSTGIKVVMSIVMKIKAKKDLKEKENEVIDTTENQND